MIFKGFLKIRHLKYDMVFCEKYGKMGNCELVLPGGDHAINEQRPKDCAYIVLEFIIGLDID